MSSAPELPSMAEWWTLVTTPMRSCLRPSMTQSSQRGRDRSSGVLAIWPAISPSSRRPPGAGQPMRRMWKSMSKSGSSIHTGWARFSGTSTSRRRNGGTRWMRPRMNSLRFSNEYPPGTVDGSTTMVMATCMWLVGFSR